MTRTNEKREPDGRLTDGGLAYVERLANADDWTDAQTGRAQQMLGVMLKEIKERRALDLTSEEREALGSLWHIVHEWLSAEQANGVRLARHIDTEHALAILDRLVKGTP